MNQCVSESWVVEDNRGHIFSYRGLLAPLLCEVQVSNSIGLDTQ